MSSAANAVADMIAPPPRAATAKAAPSDPSDTSFDDHLEAATADDAADAPAPVKDDDAPDSIVCADTPAPSPQPEPTPAPVLLQLIAAAPPAPTPAPDTAPVEAAAAAPEAAAPVAPIAPEAAPEPEGANDATQPHEKNAAKVDAAPQQDASTQPATPAPAEATPIAAPSPTATQTPPTASAEQSAQAAALAPVVAPQANAPREAPVRTAKVDAATTAKVDAPEREAKSEAPQPVAAKNNGAKNAPVGPAAKENAAPAPAHENVAPAPAAIALATQSAAQTQHAVLEQNTVRTAPAATQVGHEIVRRFNGQNMQFDMRLDPPELGRVDVRLEVSRDHRVTAVVSADSPQALTELARHARELEQTLQSAGLELSDSGLSFDLRQNSEGAERGDNNRGASQGAQGSEDAPQDPVLRAQPLGIERWRGVRVDVMV